MNKLTLALEAHKKLREEKEALKELLDSQVKANCGIAARLNEVEQSRDELLGACDDATTGLYDSLHGGNSEYAQLSVAYTRNVLDKLETVIKKSQALKEKANDTNKRRTKSD